MQIGVKSDWIKFSNNIILRIFVIHLKNKYCCKIYRLLLLGSKSKSGLLFKKLADPIFMLVEWGGGGSVNNTGS